ARRKLRPSPNLDLFNPAFQEYLTGFLTDLADTGIDGVLFRADAPLGLPEGFSSHGLAGFEHDFGIRLDPSKLFARSDQTGPSPRSLEPQARQEHPPEFWRWVGWKARGTLKVLDQLRRAMRQHSPRLQFALEVHPETVTAPVEALAEYGEDLLEAKRSRFDYYLLGAQHAAVQSVVKRLIELLGGADRIWVAAPLPEGDLAGLGERLRPTADRASRAKGIGVMYMNASSSIP
ncbi:MAG TPA: hypothetical protein VJM82_06460, partial [Nitrospiraceae bacterium]|nr:hypothetical protein [Nitrospiraceae bacterium]